MATISSVYARIVVRRLMDQSIDVAELLEGTRLTRAQLWSDAEIELQEFATLLKTAQGLYSNTPIGFLIGSHHGIQALGHLGVAMSSAPNLRSGIQVLQSYTAVHTSYIRVLVDAEVAGARISLMFDNEARAVEMPHTEASMMFFRHYIETVSTREFTDGHYEFYYATPKHIDRYPDFFGPDVSFDRPNTSLFVPQDYLDLPSPFYNPEIWGQSMRQLAKRLKELGSTDSKAFQRHIRSLLRSQMPPFPSLEEIAEQLHVSPRTLNRRLQQEGTSYRELRSDLIDEWAKSFLLDTDDSVASISVTLGYSDVANFRRAFKARNEMSFTEYRQKHRASPRKRRVEMQ